MPNARDAHVVGLIDKLQTAIRVGQQNSEDRAIFLLARRLWTDFRSICMMQGAINTSRQQDVLNVLGCAAKAIEDVCPEDSTQILDHGMQAVAGIVREIIKIESDA